VKRKGAHTNERRNYAGSHLDRGRGHHGPLSETAAVSPKYPVTNKGETHTTKGENEMYLAMQGAIWLGAGVTLVMLLSRRRRRRTVL
jgi:hypothetical protein